MFRLCSFVAVFWLAVAASSPALAYIGPGAGLSAIGTAVALIGAVFLLIVGFVWYPVKRMLRGRKESGHARHQEPDAG